MNEIDFVEVDGKDLYDDKYYPENGYVICVYFRYDRMYNAYNRQVYNIMALLGDIGGMYSSLFSIGLIFISFYNHRLFISAILRNLY